jgi:hypothetical protein
MVLDEARQLHGEGNAMVDSVSAYLDAAATRLTSDGCEVRAENWSGTKVIVGHRSDFRLRWMATKLHLVTIVAPSAAVTQEILENFTNSAMDYALARKGEFRGLQSGIAVFPALVSMNADTASFEWAQQRQRVRFACLARPVVVDLTRGVVGCFRGNAALGWIYAGHLRGKLDVYFPRTVTPVDAGPDSLMA